MLWLACVDDARGGCATVRLEGCDDPEVLNSLCYSQAKAGLDSEQALADCDASLQGERIAATLASRTFLLLRLNRNQEAKAAFDDALSVNPKFAASLYSGSLEERRLGDPAAEKDKTAALYSNANIVKT